MVSLEEELKQLPTDWESKSLGGYQNHQSMQFKKERLTVNARIPENYPEDPAVIELEGSDWENMSGEMKCNVLREINEYARLYLGQAMLNHILEEAWNMTRCKALGTQVAQKQPVKSHQQRKPKKKTKYRPMVAFGALAPIFSSVSTSTKYEHSQQTDAGTKQFSENKKSHNTPSMKTAKDVINRLKHDEQLKNENFFAGYENHSNRMVEIPVSSIKWEGNAVTADSANHQSVPEHLIKHFTWNSSIVWERITETDHVFGSGSIGKGSDIIEFIERHRAQSQLESHESHISSLEKQENTIVDQKSSDIKECQIETVNAWDQFQESVCIKSESIVNSTNVESSCKDSIDEKDSVESSVDAVISEVNIANENDDSVLLNDSLEPGKDVRQFTSEDEIPQPDVACGNADQIDIGKCDAKFKNDMVKELCSHEFSDEAGMRSSEHSNAYCQNITEHDSDGSFIAKVVNSLQIPDDIKSNDTRSESMNENLMLDDEISECDKTNLKSSEVSESETNPDVENPMLGLLLSDEEGKCSDSISCPKDVTTREKKHQYNYQPYDNVSKEKRSVKRSKRSDRERYERLPELDNKSRQGSSAEIRHRYRYCIAVDIDEGNSRELRKLRRQIVHIHKSNARLRNEPYFFINVADVTFENVQERRNVEELLRKVCKDLKAFTLAMHTVKLQGKAIVVTIADEAFHDFSKKLLEQKPSNVSIECNPRIPLLQVCRDSRGLEIQNFPSLELKFFVPSMYLWNLDDDDRQCVKYINLVDNMNHQDDESNWRLHDSRSNSRYGVDKNSKWEVTVSKTLSGILRHNHKNFTIDKEGYLDVNLLLQHQFFKKHDVKESDIECIVETNEKKRFALHGCPGNYKIRATQGHSVQGLELNLRKLESSDEFPDVIHGTMYKLFESIRHQGLKRMTRNHIHMTTGLPRDENHVISGMRSSSDCFIYVDVKKAMDDGIKFFVSDNGVILSEGVDGTLESKYFRKVVRRTNGKDHELLSWDTDKPKSAVPDTKL